MTRIAIPRMTTITFVLLVALLTFFGLTLNQHIEANVSDCSMEQDHAQQSAILHVNMPGFDYE